MLIEDIKKLVADHRIKWTSHCVKQMIERDISRSDVLHCINHGEIIEDYPNDYPFPSSLLFGQSENKRAIHVVVGSDGEKIYIITAYIPNIIKFETDLKTRRK